jgi:hypothetical protein
MQTVTIQRNNASCLAQGSIWLCTSLMSGIVGFSHYTLPVVCPTRHQSVFWNFVKSLPFWDGPEGDILYFFNDQASSK